MELTLKRLLEQAEFTKTRGGGYDRGEVDDFLDRTVAMATKVEARLTQALEEAKGAGKATGAPAPSEADLEAEVQRRLQARLAEAPPAPAGPSEEETAEQVRRTIVLAERTANEAVREAREEAASLLADAKERAAALTAEADEHAARVTSEADAKAAELTEGAASEAEAARSAAAAEVAAERQAARNRLALEISSIEGVREALRSDVAVLERHVEEQRTQLRSTVGELQRLLDDPAGFRLAPAPALLDPEVPDLTEPEEPAAEVDPAPEVEAEGEVDADVEAAAPEAAVAEPEPEPEAESEPEPEPEPERSDAPVAEDAPALPQLNFAEVDHEQPGVIDLVDPGPPTAPVSMVELTAADDPEANNEDDAFLAELRKAMADDEPLGPRDSTPDPLPSSAFGDEDRRGWRFGKRR